MILGPGNMRAPRRVCSSCTTNDGQNANSNSETALFSAVQLQVELQRADVELHLRAGGNDFIFHFQMRISTLVREGAPPEVLPGLDMAHQGVF